MARHRSPRGRHAIETRRSPAHRLSATDGGTHRPVDSPVPVRRGVAVAAVAGGALSLTGATAAGWLGVVAAPDPGPGTDAQHASAAPASRTIALVADTQRRPGSTAALAPPAVLDAAALVTAVNQAGGRADAMRAAAQREAAKDSAKRAATSSAAKAAAEAEAATADKAADKAAADRAATDKATADKATADKATADKATADEEAADKTSTSSDTDSSDTEYSDTDSSDTESSKSKSKSKAKSDSDSSYSDSDSDSSRDADDSDRTKKSSTTGGSDSDGSDSDGSTSGGSSSTVTKTGGSVSTDSEAVKFAAVMRGSLAPGVRGEGAGAGATEGVAGGVGPAGLGQAKNPNQIIGSKNWYLTLPTGREGDPDTIEQSALAGYSSKFFQLNNARNGVVFTADSGGATTSGSNFPRSELREMNGNEKASWDGRKGRHTMEIVEAITETPKTKPDVIAGQIHATTDDLMQIHLSGNLLRVKYADGQKFAELDRNYQLGTPFAVKIESAEGKVKVWYNGVLKADLPISSSTSYFKAGVYTNSNTSTGDKASAEGQVVIHSLTVRHEQ